MIINYLQTINYNTMNIAAHKTIETTTYKGQKSARYLIATVKYAAGRTQENWIPETQNESAHRYSYDWLGQNTAAEAKRIAEEQCRRLLAGYKVEVVQYATYLKFVIID